MVCCIPGTEFQIANKQENTQRHADSSNTYANGISGMMTRSGKKESSCNILFLTSPDPGC